MTQFPGDDHAGMVREVIRLPQGYLGVMGGVVSDLQ